MMLMMFRHRSSRTKSKGSSEDTSSGGLFQGTTQSRHRKEQLLGCLQAQAQEEAPQEDPMGEGDVAGGSSSVRRFRYYLCIVSI